MTGGDCFVAVVAALEAGASITYLSYNGDWKQSLLWGAACVTNVAYLLMTRVK